MLTFACGIENKEMKNVKNRSWFGATVVWLLGIHVCGLAVLSLFRAVEYLSLSSMVTNEAPVAPAFVRGVWFDNVVACYLMVVPLAVVLIAAALGCYNRALRLGANVWFCILYPLLFMASAANIPYFAYFFKNINSSIFDWFGYTGTTAGMVFQERSYWLYIGLFFLLTALFVVLLVWWRKHIDALIGQQTEHRIIWPTVALRLVCTAALVGLCIFGIRGRTGYNPIKISQAYYCNDPFLNQLGINPAFNLLTSVLDDNRSENAELHLTDYASAIDFVRHELHIEGPADSLHVLRRQVAAPDSSRFSSRPNIVFILMESMSAAFLGRGITPVLDSLAQQSLSFTRFYSAGIHTNHGMTATLYSFPALMKRNLMKGTVTPHRDGIPTVLKENGYHNLFFMTHEAQYDNMNAFFRTNGYDEIYAQEDYPRDEVVNSFGVSDHFLFDFALSKINELGNDAPTATEGQPLQPFMATILTISNHPPYVVPDWFHPKTKEPETQIVEYADWCIGDFLRKAAKQSWFANTIFIVEADHGKIVGDVDAELPQSYNHIPLMIFGRGIEPRTYDGLGMQVDVMPTLLGILGLSYQYDGFGVDLLRESRRMVFYSADDQVVARDSSRYFIYTPKLQKSFCYDALPDGHLRENADENAFSALCKYVFSMIQTAEFMQQHAE